MNKRKKIIGTLVATVLLLSLCIPQMCFAEEGNIDEGITVSREEVAESIAESEGVTYDEALQDLIDSEEALIAEKGFKRMPRKASISYKYYTAEKSIVPKSLKLDAWAYVQVWNEGSFRQFEEIVNTGSGAIGITAGAWNPSVSAKLTTPIRLDLSCRGYLSTKTTFSVSASAKLDIFAAGLDVTGNIGTEMSITGRVDFSKRWDLY